MAIDFPNTPSVGQIYTAPSGASWQWNGTIWGAVASGVISGASNKSLNPFMEIDQAHEGASTAFAANSSGYVIDGLVCNNNGSQAVSVVRSVNAPPGYSNSVLLTVTTPAALAAGTALGLQERVEAKELIDTLAGTSTPATLSMAFWVRCFLPGIYTVALRGAGGTTRTYAFNYTISAVNTWQLITQTIPGDTVASILTSGNAIGMYIDYSICVGSSGQGAAGAWTTGSYTGTSAMLNTLCNTNGATFQLGPRGLWVAPAPQPLLRTSFQSELSRCQRYYEKSYDIGTAIGTATQNGASTAQLGMATGTVSIGTNVATFKTSKRASPTVSMYSSSTGTAGKVRDITNNADVNQALGGGGTNSFIWSAIMTAANVNLGLVGHWTADARL